MRSGEGTSMNFKTQEQSWRSPSLVPFCTCDGEAPSPDFLKLTTACWLGSQGCSLVRNHFGSRVDQMDLGKKVGYLHCPHFSQNSNQIIEKPGEHLLSPVCDKKPGLPVPFRALGRTRLLNDHRVFWWI